MLQPCLPDTGALFVVSGPSGVGKSTLLRAAMARIPGLSFSVSATTRPPRPGEVDGVDYRFLSAEQFHQLVNGNAFLEHATVYDRSYGTLREPTESALAAGQSLILDVDVQGARAVKLAMSTAVLVYILPPDLPTLERRLRGRQTDSEETIRRRMDQVGQQLEAVGEFDYLVVNDHLETAQATFEGILLGELCRSSRNPGLVSRFQP